MRGLAAKEKVRGLIESWDDQGLGNPKKSGSRARNMSSSCSEDPDSLWLSGKGDFRVPVGVAPSSC